MIDRYPRVSRQVGRAGGMSNQSIEGGQGGIELAQVVEMVGSRGSSWQRWWVNLRWWMVGSRGSSWQRWWVNLRWRQQVVGEWV